MLWPCSLLLESLDGGFFEVSDLRRARCGRGCGGSRLQRGERPLVGLSHEAGLSEAGASSVGGEGSSGAFIGGGVYIWI